MAVGRLVGAAGVAVEGDVGHAVPVGRGGVAVGSTVHAADGEAIGDGPADGPVDGPMEGPVVVGVGDGPSGPARLPTARPASASPASQASGVRAAW